MMFLENDILLLNFRQEEFYNIPDFQHSHTMTITLIRQGDKGF